MGEPKYRLKIGGKTFVERAASALRTTTAAQISIVGEIDDRYLRVQDTDGKDYELRKIRDIVTNNAERGALRGLYTALAKANTEWISILACDLPFVTCELITRLTSYCSNQFDAVVPVQPDAKLQPLCAFYRREKCLPIVEQMIDEGDWEMRRLVSRLRTRFVEFEEITELDGSANFFLNINNAEDYKTALKIATCSHREAQKRDGI